MSQNKINLKWWNWSDNTSPHCKTYFSTSEWIWHAKNHLVKLQKKWDLDFPFFCGRHPLDESRCFRWVGHDNHLTDASMQGWNWVDYYVSDYNDAELQKVYLVASRDIIFPPQSASIPIKYNQLYVQNLHLSFCIQEYLLIWKNKCGKLYQLKRRNALNLNSKNEIIEAKVPLYASVNITSHIRRILKGRQSSKKGLRVGLGRICWSHHTAVSSRLSATGQLFE